MDVKAPKKTYHTEANPTIVMTPAAKVGLFVFGTWRFDYTTEIQDLSMFFGCPKH
jgi:hypothetical protein